MTNYEFLDKVIEYVKREHNVNLYVSEFGKNKIMLETSYSGKGGCGGTININDDFERFKKRVYEVCNFCLKGR